MPGNYVIGPDENLKFSTTAGGGGDYDPVGHVVNGSVVEDTVPLPIEPVGTYTPRQIRPGLFRCWGRASVHLQTHTFPAYAIRNTGTGLLTPLSFQAGNRQEYVEHRSCKINSLMLECSAGGPLLGGFDWRGISISPSGSGIDLSEAPSSNDVMMWFDGSISGFANSRGAGASPDITRMTINVNNNIDWRPVIRNNNTPERGAAYIVEGRQQVTCNLAMLLPENIDMSTEDLAQIATATFTFNNEEGQQILITLSTLARQTQERPLTPAELIEHGATYVVSDITIAAS